MGYERPMMGHFCIRNQRGNVYVIQRLERLTVLGSRLTPLWQGANSTRTAVLPYSQSASSWYRRISFQCLASQRRWAGCWTRMMTEHRALGGQLCSATGFGGNVSTLTLAY